MNPQTKQFCFVAMLFRLYGAGRSRASQDLLSDWLVVGSQCAVSSPLVMPARPCLKAFWFAGGPDLPGIPAIGDNIANRAPIFSLNWRSHSFSLCLE